MPNQRLQKLMKERNIQPINLPTLKDRPIILAGPDDHRFPKEIAVDIQQLQNVAEVAMFQPNEKRKTCEFRVMLRASDNFNKYIFYTCDV